MIILRLLATIIILISISYCKLPDTDNRILQVEVVDQADFEAELVNVINAKRQELGLSTLVTSALLMQVAEAHSQDMATRRYLEHASPEGVHAGERIRLAGYKWYYWGEVIAGGSASPQAVFDDWMGSPLHKAVLLDGVYEEIGVGFVYDDTTKYHNYWTVNLAIPKGKN